MKNKIDRITSYNVCYTKLLRQGNVPENMGQLYPQQSPSAVQYPGVQPVPFMK